MNTYGDVVENSPRRGKIKGTDIETGTRYLQMVNVKEVLPTSVNMGRFKVRVFSDNNTECRICKEVGHPFYRCPRKNDPNLENVDALSPIGRIKILTNVRRIWTCADNECVRCKRTTHRTRDCTYDIVCNFCNESGHK